MTSASDRRADANAVRLARARLRLTAGVAGLRDGRSSRTLARRGAALRAGIDLFGLPDAATLLLADPGLLDATIAMAAAALNGHDVAQSVTPRDRAPLIERIGATARDFAVAHRALARPATGLRGDALADRISADGGACRTAWHASLSWGVTVLAPADDAEVPDLPSVLRCLDVAARVAIAAPDKAGA